MIGKSLFAVNLVQYLKDKDGEEHFAEAEAPDNRAAAVPIGRTRHFISSLMELGVRFRAVAFLDADPFNLHFQAEMAERARWWISTRTKAAWQNAKANEVKLDHYGMVLACQNAACDRDRACSIFLDKMRRGLGEVIRCITRPVWL